MQTDILDPPQQVQCIDLRTGERQRMNASPDFVRMLTFDGLHSQTFRRSIWRVCGWDDELRREVAIGYLVTTDKSRRSPGCLLAQSRPVALVPGVDRRAFRYAQVIAADADNWSILTREQVEKFNVFGMLLYPMRRNGELMKISRQRMPAAMIVRRDGGDGMSFHHMTAAEVRHVQEQKSGTPQSLTPTQALTQVKREAREATAA